ncbi:hypothetical protein ACFWZT_37610 [Streptomyces alboflavus]|uniref:hypothetical protein n=1 Tax=Streptomyces alboflavus TaxID=67267 RepID=UPI0036B8AC47
MLYPAGSDAESPDVSWSYTGFSMFRKWLARYEGDADPAHRRRVDDVRELTAVLEHCVTYDVGLVFG